MKKLLAIAAVLLMIFTLSGNIFAAEITPDPVKLKKEYELNGGTVTPAEELGFNVEYVSGAEGGVSELPVVGTGNKVQISSGTELATEFSVTLPTYKKVGIYTYKITETKGSTLGVDYDTDPVFMVVTITNSSTETTSDALSATVAFHKGTLDGKKVGSFVNTYGLGKLTVTKDVTGNLASNEVKFKIKVAFSGDAKSEISYTIAGGEVKSLQFKDGKAETEILLSNTQSAVFTNIPAGITYTVEESSSHAEGKEKPENTAEDKGYTVTYKNSDNATATSGTGSISAGDADTVTVKNEKKTEIQTGIDFDSVPYILLMALVLAMIVNMMMRKRKISSD